MEILEDLAADVKESSDYSKASDFTAYEDEDFSQYSFFDELFNGGDGDIDSSLTLKLGISVPDGFDKDVDGNDISYTFTALKKADEIYGEIQLNKKDFDDEGAAVVFWSEDGDIIGDIAFLDPDISILDFGKVINKHFGDSHLASLYDESTKRKVIGRVSVREAKAFRQGYRDGKRRASIKEGNTISRTNGYIASALKNPNWEQPSDKVEAIIQNILWHYRSNEAPKGLVGELNDAAFAIDEDGLGHFAADKLRSALNYAKDSNDIEAIEWCLDACETGKLPDYHGTEKVQSESYKANRASIKEANDTLAGNNYKDAYADQSNDIGSDYQYEKEQNWMNSYPYSAFDYPEKFVDNLNKHLPDGVVAKFDRKLTATPYIGSGFEVDVEDTQSSDKLNKTFKIVFNYESDLDEIQVAAILRPHRAANTIQMWITRNTTWEEFGKELDSKIWRK